MTPPSHIRHPKDHVQKFLDDGLRRRKNRQIVHEVNNRPATPIPFHLNGHHPVTRLNFTVQPGPNQPKSKEETVLRVPTSMASKALELALTAGKLNIKLELTK